MINFSGMESLGLGMFENLDIYGANEENQKQEIKDEKKVSEESYLLHKTFECPVCAAEFKQLVIRHNKVRTLGHDIDLRPRCDGIDITKYEVVVCNNCGYASLIKFYGPLPKPYRNLIRDKIMPNYKPMKMGESVISYEEAVMRYKLALLNAVVRQAKNSEKAFIALRLSWIYRGMREALSEKDFDYEEKMEILAAQEQENQQLALEGFKRARNSETAAIAGTNEYTIDYLLAVLNMEAGDYAYSHKLLSELLVSPNASKAQKKQVEEVLDELKMRIKKSRID